MVEHGRHISIGRFAGLTGISANTLRRYDELGVLSPAFTDPETRYRLYAVEQLDTGILIRLLRDLDVPLKEIAAQIGDGDPGRLRDALAVHRERIAGRLVELERILQRLGRRTGNGARAPAQPDRSGDPRAHLGRAAAGRT